MPARVVERIGIDRHARAAGFLEQDHQFADGDVLVDGLDIGARHHHVGDAHLAEAQDVVQHRPLIGRKDVAVGRVGHQRIGDDPREGASPAAVSGCAARDQKDWDRPDCLATTATLVGRGGLVGVLGLRGRSRRKVAHGSILRS